MSDQHDDPAGDEPITPEVVRPRGAAARKRRRGDGDADAGAHASAEAGADAGADEAGGDGDATRGAPMARQAPMVRLGAMILVALGIMQLVLTSQWVIDPEGARCRSARLVVERANDDDEDFNDVELPDGVDDVDDLECDQAIELAGNVPADEDDEPDGEFAEASQFRLQGIGIGVLGLAQAVTGFLVLRTGNRLARNVALGTAAVGILLPVLGIVSLLALAFVVFALAFSKDAKATWGSGGFLRPRPPASGGPASG